MEMIVKVKDCRDCPYRRSSRGKDDNWEECGHPNHGQPPYMDILWEGGGFSSVPNWCPIRSQEFAVTAQIDRPMQPID
jgi:hypothetical protein